MEVNKLYKSVCNGLVVKCITLRNDGLFGGIVVQAVNSKHKEGYVGNSWYCHSFEEYTPTQVLTNGHSYNIPDGCKATIENGVVLIESNVKYYKKDNITYRIYARVEGDKMVKLVIDVDGSKDIFIRYGCTDVDYSVVCTEEEFMKAYNSIKIEL